MGHSDNKVVPVPLDAAAWQEAVALNPCRMDLLLKVSVILCNTTPRLPKADRYMSVCLHSQGILNFGLHPSTRRHAWPVLLGCWGASGDEGRQNKFCEHFNRLDGMTREPDTASQHYRQKVSEKCTWRCRIGYRYWVPPRKVNLSME